MPKERRGPTAMPVVAAGSILDLNNLHLYALTATIDDTATILNGSVTLVSEPAMVGLAALCGSLALIRRRRRA